MYDTRTHTVPDRIVSISQPYVRPIVRGKAKASTEFGAKLHLSIDEMGFGRIEHLSFDAYNEGPLLIDALNAYLLLSWCFPDDFRQTCEFNRHTMTESGFAENAEPLFFIPMLPAPLLFR